MLAPRPILRFLAVFTLVYGVLIAPWPGWNAAYALAFRGLGEGCFGSTAPKVVRFRAMPGGGALDTQIVIYDPSRADAQGRIHARMLGLDTRGVGWVPTAFLCALIAASPVTWARRLRALALGLASLYLYLLLAVRVYIWSATLTNASTATRAVASGLEETLIVQLGPSFVVPAILWLLVTFRQADFEAAFGSMGRIGRRDAAKP